MFIDEAKICLVAGRGGNGMLSFERAKYRPKGGPGGGDGGHGGSVYLRASSRVNTLLNFQDQVHFKAKSGDSGGPHNQHGRDGRDLVIPVPVGTVIKDLRSQEVLADLTQAGETLLLARGGRGGWGNVRFKNSTRQAPRIHEHGETGEERWIKLELKLLADVGLIGFPNVGKSSLLSRISAQRPKIASYPFTTLQPELGVVRVDEFHSFVAVDIPGLIAGAHQGKGLGDRFLKHVERTRLLVHLVDLSGCEGRDPWEDLLTVNRELRSFSPALAVKPQVVVGNKTDLMAEDEIERQSAGFATHGIELLPISAVTGRNLQALIMRCYQQLEGFKPPAETPSEPRERVRRLYRPQDRTGFAVTRDEKGFVIQGGAVERLERLYLEEPDAVAYLYEELARRGIMAELKRQGLQAGDRVFIGRQAFEYLEPAAG
jgi:GTP-binding protein